MTSRFESPSITRIRMMSESDPVIIDMDHETRKLKRISAQCRRLAEKPGVTQEQADRYIDAALRAEKAIGENRDKGILL